MMKKRWFDPVLALAVVGALALLAAAVWYAVLRPQSNWHFDPEVITLPESWAPPDCWISAFFLFFTALACFAGGVHYDEDTGKPEEGGDGACP